MACERRNIELTEDEDCEEIPCIGPGSWGEWGEWQKCTATCGGGERRRFRECVGGLLGTEGIVCHSKKNKFQKLSPNKRTLKIREIETNKEIVPLFRQFPYF